MPMEPRLVLSTGSAEETQNIGEGLAQMLGSRDVVSLTGDLGAGKTTLVQGLARGLGVTEPVLSPTFTLIREYQGTVLPIYHLDVYRLERLQDVVDLGFDEILDQEAIVLIEWGDAIEWLLPQTYLQVELTLPEERPTRRISLSGRGPSWAARWERLEQLATSWQKV